ncbi:MAG: Ni/Fe hydrogenase subunit alpha [Nitrospira sp.]|nr:Ni/Fe hydrogenase subunit alpha [Nitrospira sp.]
MKLNIDYIARVEGEGSVKLEIEEGTLKDLKLNIWEPPRFFEGFLHKRRFDEVPDIVARICGICPVSHMTTAIRALEKAFGFVPSPEVVKIRKIMALSQIVASHLIHLYMLAFPDYHRLHSVTQMLPGFELEIRRLIKMKEVVNNVTALFGGRPLHPVAMVVGGFTQLPSRDMVGKVIKELESIKDDAVQTLRMVSNLPFPDLTNDSEYVGLHGPSGYAINEGIIVSNDGIKIEEDGYYSVFKEDEVSYSNAKRTHVKGRGSLMVGALARLNLKFEMLHPDAKKAAEEIGFTVPDHNPFHNNIAQAIEIVHGISECMELLDGLNLKDSNIPLKLREGEGIALTEAPRGLLCHHYVVNRKGIIERANIITPTAHNFMSLEENLRKLIQQYINEEKEEIVLKCEMLVRAYDPCFSCSVH